MKIIKRAGTRYYWSDMLNMNQQAQPLVWSGSIISVTESYTPLGYLQIQKPTWTLEKNWKELDLWIKTVIETHMSLVCLRSLARAMCATPKKASSTLVSSFAEVSWYSIFPFEPHHSMALLFETYMSRIKEVRVFDGLIKRRFMKIISAYNSAVSAIYIGLVPD